MTVVAFHLEGDEATMAAGCEMIVRAIAQFTGRPMLGADTAPPSLALPRVKQRGRG